MRIEVTKKESQVMVILLDAIAKNSSVETEIRKRVKYLKNKFFNTNQVKLKERDYSLIAGLVTFYLQSEDSKKIDAEIIEALSSILAKIVDKELDSGLAKVIPGDTVESVGVTL